MKSKKKMIPGGLRGTDAEDPLDNKRVPFIIAEDNHACIKIVKKGRCPTMRHINRTHRIAMDWLYETCQTEQIKNVPINIASKILLYSYLTYYLECVYTRLRHNDVSQITHT